MSKNLNERLVHDVEEVELPNTQEQSRFQKYLQNLFHIAWSKLAALIGFDQATSQQQDKQNYQFDEEYRSDSTTQRYFYCRFADRVDPSLYYTVFRHRDK